MAQRRAAEEHQQQAKEAAWQRTDELAATAAPSADNMHADDDVDGTLQPGGKRNAQRSARGKNNHGAAKKGGKKRGKAKGKGKGKGSDDDDSDDSDDDFVPSDHRQRPQICGGCGCRLLERQLLCDTCRRAASDDGPDPSQRKSSSARRAASRKGTLLHELRGGEVRIRRQS